MVNLANCFAWLNHYESEFAESPFQSNGRLIRILQNYLTGYDWKSLTHRRM